MIYFAHGALVGTLGAPPGALLLPEPLVPGGPRLGAIELPDQLGIACSGAREPSAQGAGVIAALGVVGAACPGRELTVLLMPDDRCGCDLV